MEHRETMLEWYKLFYVYGYWNLAQAIAKYAKNAKETQEELVNDLKLVYKSKLEK